MSSFFRATSHSQPAIGWLRLVCTVLIAIWLSACSSGDSDPEGTLEQQLQGAPSPAVLLENGDSGAIIAHINGLLRQSNVATLAALVSEQGLVIVPYGHSAPAQVLVGDGLLQALEAMFSNATPQVVAYQFKSDGSVGLVLTGLNRVELASAEGALLTISSPAYLELRQIANGSWEVWLLAVDRDGQLARTMHRAPFQTVNAQRRTPPTPTSTAPPAVSSNTLLTSPGELAPLPPEDVAPAAPNEGPPAAEDVAPVTPGEESAAPAENVAPAGPGDAPPAAESAAPAAEASPSPTEDVAPVAPNAMPPTPPSDERRLVVGQVAAWLQSGDVGALANLVSEQGLIVSPYGVGLPSKGLKGAMLTRTLEMIVQGANPRVAAYDLSVPERIGVVVTGLNQVEIAPAVGDVLTITNPVYIVLDQREGVWKLWFMAVDRGGMLAEAVKSPPFEAWQ